MASGFIFIIVILIFSVIIHEVMHGYAALWLGDPTARLAGRLTLNPLKHIDPFGSIILPLIMALLPGGIIFGWAKPVPYNPYNLQAGKWGPAIVAAAGPASNIILALLFGLLVQLAPLTSLTLPASFVAIAGAIVLINLMLAVFNLIPIPPLDGSKILLALAPYRFAQKAEALGQYSLILVFLLIFFVWGAVVNIVFSLAFLFAGQAPILLALSHFFTK